MAGGFTKYNKLEVTDLGTEGTGDRIALFNSDGRLIGYVLKESLEGFLPLSGGRMTGQIQTEELNAISSIQSDLAIGCADTYDLYDVNRVANVLLSSDEFKSRASLGSAFLGTNVSLGLRSTSDGENFCELLNEGDVNFKGFVGNALYNKQNDPNAFAQVGDVQDATGHASYTDTAYSVGSPLTLLAGVNTVLPNNSGVIYDDEKPDDITTFYNGTTITGRDGDGLAIMIYFKATPSTINSELDIWIDIGGGIGELYRQTVYFRGATKKGVLYTLPTAYTRATWESNGGTVYVKASVNMTVYGMNFNISRTHKSKN